jgi:hypothetical protein
VTAERPRFYTEGETPRGNPHASRPSLTAPFRRYDTTDEQASRDGYRTGLSWTHDYRPGGPWRAGCDERRDHPDWVMYADLRSRHCDLWLQGFDRGWAERKVALDEGILSD